MLNFFILVNVVILCPIVIYGIIIAFINKLNSKNLHTQSKWWIYTMCGFIGTPIHELSHLIFNLIFFHKVKEVQLYRPRKSRKDGILGYVNFSHNEKSLYQNVGLFFTGIGPMIGGCAVLYLLMVLLLPDAFHSLVYTKIESLDIIDILLNLKENMITNLTCIFTKYSSLQNLIIFLVLAFSISTHMHISPADLKTAIKGFWILEVIILLVSVVLGLIGDVSSANVVLMISSYMLSFLTMGLAFSLIALLISFLISLIPE